MILHENREVFLSAIRAASDHLNIRDVFVEKDYWVTYLLKQLSLSDYSKAVVFKGGTSLSKVHKLIDRFSEDVDLAILKSKDQTETQVRIMIRSIEKELTAGFTEIELEGITSKRTNFRKTAYNYTRIIDHGSPTGIQERLILEINSFANPVPYEAYQVNSMIGQFLFETNNLSVFKEYDLESFELNVLIPQSSLIEKILALVRLSFYENNIEKIRPKVRHLYDIFFLSNSKYCKDYLATQEFIDHFDRMHKEDKTKFDDPHEWLISSYKVSPIFTSFENIWSKVKDTYENEFKLLVYGEFPEEKKISEKFKEIIEILK